MSFLGLELIFVVILECCLKNPNRARGVVQGLAIAHMLLMGGLFMLFLWGHIELYKNTDVGSYDD